MRVRRLNPRPGEYTCNAYLVMGGASTLDAVNALVDIGLDAYILEEVRGIPGGIGKRSVESVYLTHGHFDHAGGLEGIRRELAPEIRAWAPLPGVRRTLQDNEAVRLGDRAFTVLHTPGHSEDSICLYCAEEQVLFSGDTPVQIRTAGGAYPRSLQRSIERLCRLPIATIFPGHGPPITERANEMLRMTLESIRQSGVEV